MSSGGSLAALGFSDFTESVYRSLLDRPGSTLPELGELLGTDDRTLMSAIDALGRQGLVEKSLGTPVRYVPVAPDLGLEALVVKAQGELDKARILTKELTAEFQKARSPLPPELVEVVTGTEAVNRRFEDLQRRATREVQCLDTPPYAGPEGGTTNSVEMEALARGVVYRGIYDRAALEAGSGTINAVARYVAAGEQARFVNHLPLKLATIDKELGFVPLLVDQKDIAKFLVVRPCSLLDTLLYVFDILWESATPFTFGDHESARAEPSPKLTAMDRRILNLLAAGLKDQAIAHHLQLSYSTTRRHIAALMDRLDAETRFQAGLQAGFRLANHVGSAQQPACQRCSDVS